MGSEKGNRVLARVGGGGGESLSVAGSIPTIGDFHTVGPCKKAVFACLATIGSYAKLRHAL